MAELGIRRPGSWSHALLEVAHDLGELSRELTTCVLDVDSAPEEALLGRAFEITERAVNANRYGLGAGAISSLLPLVARHGDPAMADRVAALVEQFLGASTTSPQIRREFVDACHFYLTRGVWAERVAGERRLVELGIDVPGFSTRLQQVQQRLLECLHDTAAQPSAEELASAIDDAECVFRGHRLGRASHLLEPLLPLVDRLGDPDLAALLHALVVRFLSVPTFPPGLRRAFAATCYGHIDEGAWRDREAAERLLATLGIIRTAAPAEVSWEPEARGASSHELVLRTLEKEVLALLALAARGGSARPRETLTRQLHALLADPSFGTGGRRRFANACYRLVDQGAWADPQDGERLLVSLGIERPPTAGDAAGVPS